MDFGRDFSAQAREEWRGIKLANTGQNLTFLEWRKCQLQFEFAADRVDDKNDREEFVMLYDQLSPFWQEKVIKAEKSRPEGQNWVRISTGGNLSKEDLHEFLHCHGIQNSNVQKRDNFFLVHCTNPRKRLEGISTKWGNIASECPAGNPQSHSIDRTRNF